MSSSGNARKYASNRKQELQLQKELEEIKKKSLVNYFGKKEEAFTAKATSESSVVFPKPPSKPKPVDLHVRKNVSRIVQTKQENAQEEAKLKVSVHPTKTVKFAITSSMQTSSPVAYARRESLKPLDSLPQPPKIVTSLISRDPVEVATTLPQQTASTQSIGALDSNYGIPDVVNSRSFSSNTPGSDFNTSSAESLHIQPEYSTSQVSIDIKKPELIIESSVVDTDSGSQSRATEDSCHYGMEDRMDDSVVGDAEEGVIDESTRQSCRLKLEIDMRFQDEVYSSEQTSRYSSVARPSTIQTPEYETSEPMHDESAGDTPTPVMNSEIRYDEHSESIEKQPLHDLKASSEALDKTQSLQSQESIASKSISSQHTLKEESEPEFHVVPLQTSIVDVSGDHPSSVLSDDGHTPALSGHALSSKQSSKESSFHRQSKKKGKASTMFTGNNMFSESASTLGLTFSIPSHLSETSSSHNVLSQAKEEAQEDAHQALNIDHMFEPSEHHLMTTSWLDNVNVVQTSAPSSFHSVSNADTKEGFLSSQSSYVDDSYKDAEKEEVGSDIEIMDRSHTVWKVSAKEGGDDVVGVSGGVDDGGGVLDYGGDEGGEGGGDGGVGGGSGDGQGDGGGGGEGGGGGGDDGGGSGDSGKDEFLDTTGSSSSAGSLSVDDDISGVNELNVGALDDAPLYKDEVKESPGGERVQFENWSMNKAMDNLLEGKKDTPRQTLAEFLAFSDGPVSLEDITRVKGRKLTLSTPEPRKEESAQDRERKRATFLMSWEPGLNAQGSVSSHPSIHHFCTHPKEPQLPYEMEVLSRMTHTRPGVVKEKTSSHSITHSHITIRINSSTINTTTEQSKSHDIDLSSERKSSKFRPSLPSRKRKTSSSQHSQSRNVVTPPPSSNAVDDAESDDIISMAKARLKKELKEGSCSRSKSPLKEAKDSLHATPDSQRLMLDSELRKSSLKSRDGRLSTGTLSTSPTKTDRSVRFSGVDDASSNEMLLTGSRMEVAQDPTSLLWSPAPPKLSLFPETIQSHLFSKYESHKYVHFDKIERVEDEHLKGQPKLGGNFPFFTSVPAFSTAHPEANHVVIPYLHTLSTEPGADTPPTIAGAEVMTTVAATDAPSTVGIKGEGQETLDGESPTATTQFQSSRRLSLPSGARRVSIGSHQLLEGDVISDKDRESVISSSARHVSLVQSYILDIRRRSKKGSLPDDLQPSQSMPHLIDTEQEKPPERNSFIEVMKEVQKQRDSLVSHHEKIRLEKEKEQKASEADDTTTTSSAHLLEGSESTLNMSLNVFSSRKLQRQAMKAGKKLSLNVSASRSKAIRRTRSAQSRIQKTMEAVSQAPRPLVRRLSYPYLAEELKKATPQKPSTYYGSRFRTRSEPAITGRNLRALMRSHGADPVRKNHFKWAFSLWWDTWFPEVLEECRAEVAKYYTVSRTLRTSTSTKPVKPCPSISISTSLAGRSEEREKKDIEKLAVQFETEGQSHHLELAEIEPLNPSDAEGIESLQEKVDNLSASLFGCHDSGMKAVQHCRRGALQRKLGFLKESREDLDRAISLQPNLTDAYWHRHLLFLLQDDNKSALEDLTTLLKINKYHTLAYHSKAVILSKLGKFASGIYNLSQAIALSPKDPDLHFLRAELYEKRGEMEYALSDYSRVAELDPKNTEALKRQAMHKYNKNMWAASTQHFTALLLRDPNDTTARIHRAKAQYNLGRYVEALQDLSASIHLEPNNYSAFYLRACLLRTTHPHQALKDFSASLLLNDTVENVSAFVHRGVLYTEMNFHEVALADFESASRLNYSLPSPHVLAGLIHMRSSETIKKAVKCFTAAISVDPTCLRAYLCRAEAYKKAEQYQLASLDYTRAIHLAPNDPTHYLRKGEVYLVQKNYDLASLHVKIAAKLTTGFNQSKPQRALVEAFLGNHQKAINLLQEMPKSSSVSSLLGKIQFKARMFSGAADSFKECTQQMPRQSRVARSEAHFMCGRSLREGGALKKSIAEYSHVISKEPTHIQVCCMYCTNYIEFRPKVTP